MCEDVIPEFILGTNPSKCSSLDSSYRDVWPFQVQVSCALPWVPGLHRCALLNWPAGHWGGSQQCIWVLNSRILASVLTRATQLNTSQMVQLTHPIPLTWTESLSPCMTSSCAGWSSVTKSSMKGVTEIEHPVLMTIGTALSLSSCAM